MTDIQILFDDNALAISKNGTISGLLCLKTADFVFPSEKWDDLCISVLAMWANAINDMLYSKKAYSVLYFMDGHYYIRLHSISGVTYSAGFWNAEDVCVYTTEIDIIAFTKKVVLASHQLSAKLKELNLHSYTQELDDQVCELGRTLARISYT